MKKLLLFTLVIGLGLSGFAQNAARLPAHLKNFAVKAVYTPPVDEVTNFNQGINPTVKAYYFDPFETILGRTFYDLQSNASLANRITLHTDGTMAAVWTRGMEATAFNDRGTGYNYYDGSQWGPEPTATIESVKTGWPSYDAWGPNGEIIVSHHNSTTGLAFNIRTDKGTGEWTQIDYDHPDPGVDPTWPRMVTSGSNHEHIHVFYNAFNGYGGQPRALLYTRSNDGLASFDPQDIVLDGLGADYYTEINADEQTMAARGNTVVLIVADAWHDMFIMKSEDHGDNWEKTVIWEHPYPFFDWEVTITDTFFCVDNSANVAIGPDGKVHVVFGINRVLHEEAGTSYFLFPYIDGIGYWNEDMPTFSNDLSALAPPQYEYPTSEMIEDVNYIGWTQDVNGNGEIDFVDDIMFYSQ